MRDGIRKKQHRRGTGDDIKEPADDIRNDAVADRGKNTHDGEYDYLALVLADVFQQHFQTRIKIPFIDFLCWFHKLILLPAVSS